VNGVWKYERANWKPYSIRHISKYEFVYECEVWPPEAAESV